MCKGEEVALVHLREKSRKGRGEITLELVDLTGEEPINPIPAQPTGHAPYCALTECSCEPLNDFEDNSILEIMGAESLESELQGWGFHVVSGSGTDEHISNGDRDPDPRLADRLLPA